MTEKTGSDDRRLRANIKFTWWVWGTFMILACAAALTVAIWGEGMHQTYLNAWTSFLIAVGIGWVVASVALILLYTNPKMTRRRKEP